MIVEPRPPAVNLPPISPTARFRRKPNVLVRDLGGEAVLLDLDSGRYFGLNATGVRIWTLLGEGAEMATIRDLLAAEYALAGDEIAADIRELCAHLEAEGLVERVG